ncbi:MAG TPA: cyanophycin synthetase, partial [Terriglobia bacterium]|nr:cyanophycin synthetase [Terriglobia bacterium]
GETHAAIAAEKAGVIKPGRIVVSGCEHPEVREVIRQKCMEVGVELIETGGLAAARSVFHLDGRYGFDLQMDGGELRGITLQMPGRFQVKNAVMAATAAAQLRRAGFRIPSEALREGLQAAFWPGRLEIIRQRPLILLDGAHNPAAAREVAEFVGRHLKGRTLRLVYASMRDKAIGEISGILFPLADVVYLTRPGLDRAATPGEILESAQGTPRETIIEPDPARALERAVDASLPEDAILVAGSLFLVGAIKQAITAGRLAPENLAPKVLSELY